MKRLGVSLASLAASRRHRECRRGDRSRPGSRDCCRVRQGELQRRFGRLPHGQGAKTAIIVPSENRDFGTLAGVSVVACGGTWL